MKIADAWILLFVFNVLFGAPTFFWGNRVSHAADKALTRRIAGTFLFMWVVADLAVVYIRFWGIK